jgi:predicted phage baseplate assembly protein
VLDNTSAEAAAVLRDETLGLVQSGIVELKLPPRWRPGKPEGIDLPDALFWLRLRFVHGDFAHPPAIQALHLNAVRATAIETVRDEVLEFVPGSNRQKVLLGRTPVLADTLELVVLEPGLDGDTAVEWTATENLARHGPTDRVYLLDTATGEITFGDNIRGQRPPMGFRNIVARRYATGGGLSGRVTAEADFRLVQSIPFVNAVVNPQAASGGKAAETSEQTCKRGPLEIRTGGRAVTLADYELLALGATGADVARARAIDSYDARFPGATMPGSVTVLIVTSDRGSELPIADNGTLTAVAEWLTETVAPAGIQVVAAVPAFERIGVRTSVTIADGADTGQVVATALANLQAYLHPLTGGADGTGWPFGGIIRHQALTRLLIDRTPGLVAVQTLNLVVDGVARGACRDWEIGQHALIWPEGHEVIPVEAGGSA